MEMAHRMEARHPTVRNLLDDTIQKLKNMERSFVPIIDR